MWTILRSPNDWINYRCRTATELKVSVSEVAWGSGPKEYPCGVCSLMPPRPAGTEARMYSCFVYRDDVLPLFDAVEPAALTPEQDAFNRDVSAQLQTIAWFLVETRICTEARYEEKLAEFREEVQTAVGEKRAAQHNPARRVEQD